MNRSRRRRIAWRSVAAACALGVALLALSATGARVAAAATPGLNGKIAFARFNGPTATGIYTIDPNGTGESFVAGTGDNAGTCSFPACHDAGNTPAWSPDGKTIAFDRVEVGYHTQGVTAKIWSVPAGGGTDTPLVCEDLYPFSTSQCLSAEGQPAYSPDGSLIAYSSTECTGPGPGCSQGSIGGNQSIWVMPASGTGCVPPTAGGWPDWAPTPCGSEADVSGGLYQSPLTSPAWSPDGALIAYVRDQALWVMNADGTNQHVLVQAPAYFPDFSPDGSEIVFDDGAQLLLYHLADGSVSPVMPSRSCQCQDEDAVVSPDGKQIAFERLDLTNGPSHFQIYTVNVDGTNVQRVTNSMPSDDYSPSWQRVQPAAADVSVSKTDTPDPVTVGANLTYTLTVSNGGPDSAAGVSVSDPLPAGTSLVSAGSTQGTCTGSLTVTCTIGSLANAASVTVTIVVRATQVGQLSNTATVSAQTADPSLANNSATATTTVATAADLSVRLGTSGATAKRARPFVYTATVSNGGPSSAVASFTDALPAGAQFVSVQTTAGSCSATGGTLSCALGTLASGGTAVVRITVIPTGRKTTITDTGAVSSTTADPNLANNTAQVSTPVK